MPVKVNFHYHRIMKPPLNPGKEFAACIKELFFTLLQGKYSLPANDYSAGKGDGKVQDFLVSPKKNSMDSRLLLLPAA